MFWKLHPFKVPLHSLDDIIAAIATPVGEGSISVIRISGLGSLEMVDKIFQGKQHLNSVTTHSAHFGKIVDEDGSIVDEVVATVFKTPRSYTGEDVVEVSCHGGYYVTRAVLERILAAGARLAEPGEFTRRAFLNGKMDLSQAEAVADLIRSRSEQSRRASIQQLEGRISAKVTEVRERIIKLCALIELELDFSEEGIDLVGKETLLRELDEIIKILDSWIASYQHGKAIRDGIRVAIIGPPNAGKSSIFNILTDKNHAIVTDIPGTTRDVLTAQIDLEGYLFTLSDTAGLRQSSDVIEKIGIDRAKREISSADLILLVTDISNYDNDFEVIMSESNYLRENTEKIIHVRNKSDLLRDDNTIPECKSHGGGCIRISAVSRQGVTELRALMVKTIRKPSSYLAANDLLITKSRHVNALFTCKNDLVKAREDIEKYISGEAVAVSLRSSIDSLEELIGKIYTDNILNAVFSEFCIGK